MKKLSMLGTILLLIPLGAAAHVSITPQQPLAPRKNIRCVCPRKAR
jgi:hypothetical protein